MDFDCLPLWQQDKAEIAARIASHFAPLKILLKTKDEPARLKNWIRHHAAIAGPENLIILDNMSTLREVAEIYAGHVSHCPIFRFTGFHNLPHATSHYPELFAALRVSCRHFIFLDTDEYLTLYDGEARFHSGLQILSYLADHPGVEVFPGTWLRNLAGHGDRFMLPRDTAPLANGLKWGKPIISAKSDFSGILLHNTQVPHRLYGAGLVTNFFVLHRSHQSAAERIQANLRTLISYQSISPEDRFEDILKRDIVSFPEGVPRQYFIEICKLAAEPPQDPPAPESWFEIAADGKVHWNADWQQEEMQNFIRNPGEYSAELFTSWPPPV